MGYLCFTAEQANSSVSLTKSGNPEWTGHYSLDGNTWIEYIPSSTGTITLVNVGDKVYFKGIYTRDNTDLEYLKFQMTGKIAASGNIMSFCYGDDYEGQTIIPYNFMFGSLFRYCTSLITAPELPATTLTQYCYHYMFAECTSLVTASELPATTLADGCYNGLFYGCTSLTTAPKLPATTLAKFCYAYMFMNCTLLSTIKLAYTENFDYLYFQGWVASVSNTGTFYYNGTDTTRGVGEIPEGWTVKPLPLPGEEDKLYEIVKPNITADEQIHDIVYINATDSETARERYISLVTNGSLDGHTYDPLNEYRLEKLKVKLAWGNITGDIEDQTDLNTALNLKQDELKKLMI